MRIGLEEKNGKHQISKKISNGNSTNNDKNEPVIPYKYICIMGMLFAIMTALISVLPACERIFCIPHSDPNSDYKYNKDDHYYTYPSYFHVFPEERQKGGKV